MTTHCYTRRLLLITITRLEMYLKTTHILLIQTRIDWKKKKTERNLVQSVLRKILK